MGLVAALSIGVMAQAAVALKVGDPAPNFTLQASDGKTYQLSDFKGKKPVVVAWFPKAATLGCTIECKSLAANGDRIRKYDVVYFMASVDPLADNVKFAKATSIETAGQKIDKKEADFPILSDPTKDTAKAYGVLNASGTVANRWTFYIDKAIKPATSAEDMIARLGELKVPTLR
jgi:peroxiredoxin Q/BCP